MARKKAGTARNPEDKRGGGGESVGLSSGTAQESEAEARWHRVHQNDVEVRNCSACLAAFSVTWSARGAANSPVPCVSNTEHPHWYDALHFRCPLGGSPPPRPVLRCCLASPCFSHRAA